MAAQIDPFSSQHLEAACRVLADTERGLSGTQIGRLLQEMEVADPSPSMTKWKRLLQWERPRLPPEIERCRNALPVIVAQGIFHGEWDAGSLNSGHDDPY